MDWALPICAGIQHPSSQASRGSSWADNGCRRPRGRDLCRDLLTTLMQSSAGGVQPGAGGSCKPPSIETTGVSVICSRPDGQRPRTEIGCPVERNDRRPYLLLVATATAPEMNNGRLRAVTPIAGVKVIATRATTGPAANSVSAPATLFLRCSTCSVSKSAGGLSAGRSAKSNKNSPFHINSPNMLTHKGYFSRSPRRAKARTARITSSKASGPWATTRCRMASVRSRFGSGSRSLSSRAWLFQ